jgi:hypothetical protein
MPFIEGYRISPHASRASITVCLRIDIATGAQFKELLALKYGIPPSHQQLSYFAIPQDPSIREIKTQRLEDGDLVQEILKNYTYIQLKIVPCRDLQHCRPLVKATAQVGKRLAVILLETLTVGEFKRQIELQWKIPSDELRLSFKGVPLPSSTEAECAMSLTSLGVKDSDSIDVSRRIADVTSSTFGSRRKRERTDSEV